MKITFVMASADMSGGCKVIATYARLLAQRGHSVNVIAPKRRFVGGRRQYLKQLLGFGDKVPVAGHLELQDCNYRILDHYAPITVEDVPDADVLIATWWETAEWIADFPPAKGAKAYFLQHHEIAMYSDEAMHPRVNATWSLPYTKIAISRWLLDVGRELGQYDIALVPNGVDTNQFFAPERGRQESPTVGVMYATGQFKGCRFAFEAIEAARAVLPDLNIVSFGLQNEQQALPFPGNTTYYRNPPQEQIRDIYARCDVWLCASESEGFYLPFLEAMACRCPVVSTKVGGPLDFIKDGYNGYLVDVQDTEGLTDRLLKVLSTSDAQWREMSDNALLTALDSSWEKACSEFETILGRIRDQADSSEEILIADKSNYANAFDDE